MTLFLEISGPWQWKCHRHDGKAMRRYTWGCFALGWLKVGFREFTTTEYGWTRR